MTAKTPERLKEISEELDKIAKANNGKIIVSKVIEEARSKQNPLHPEFEWSDTKAANEHRKWQARQLIKIVKVEVYDKNTNTNVSVHKYTHIPNDKPRQEGVYKDTRLVIKSDREFNMAILELQRKFEGLSRTLESLRSLAARDKQVSKKSQTMLTELHSAVSALREVANRIH